MVARDDRSTASSHTLHTGLGDSHPSPHLSTSPLHNADGRSASPGSAGDRAQAAEREMHDYGGDEPDGPPPDEERGGKDHDPNEVTWDGPDDHTNPQNWSTAKKWRLTLISALITINVTFASSAPSSAVVAIQKEFGVSREVSFLLTSLFLVGYIFGPFLWAPGSELIGRRPVFIVTMFVYTMFQLGEALAHNIETLLVCRFLAGLFASSPLTNAGGVIADIWDPVGRGPAMSVFSASVFIGPVIGPFIGGFLTTSDLGWRWIFWIMMIFAGAVFVILVLFMPETYSPVLLLNKAKRLRKSNPEKNHSLYAPHERQDWSPRGVAHRTVYRPLQMLALEPILLLVTVYLSVVYGLLYGLFEAFPLIWADLRGFSPGLSGLIFVGVGLGTTAGAALNIHLGRRYKELVPRWRGSPPPENRLLGAMIGGPVLVVGIFFLGWTGAYKSVPWYVPALATVVIGVSFTLVFISFLSYIVDTYIMYAASALAANTIVRSAVAAAFPLFTTQMFTGLGIQWASTLLGCVALLLAPSPFIFYKYGARIRKHSRFAPCLDLQIAKELEQEERKGDA